MWTEFLTDTVYDRLCDCTTVKEDLRELVDCRFAHMDKARTKEDALVSVLELLDANGRDFDLTVSEWDELTK